MTLAHFKSVRCLISHFEVVPAIEERVSIDRRLLAAVDIVYRSLAIGC